MRSKSSIVKVRITTERIRHAYVKSGAAQIIVYVSILVAALQGIARGAALELYETGPPISVPRAPDEPRWRPTPLLRLPTLPG